MRGNHSTHGMTRVEVVVVLALTAFCAAIVFGHGCRRGDWGPRNRIYCSTNLRQLGLAFANYDTDYRALPSAHRNIWWLSAPYLSMAASLSENDPNAPASEIYRCPSDRMLTNKTNGCSYAPNYEAVDPFAAEEGDRVANNGDARNQAYSPWPNYKLADLQPEVLEIGRFLSLKSLYSSAPNTVFLIENWDPENLVYFANEGGLKAQPPIVRDGEIKCPRPALEDYNGPAAGSLDKDHQWVLTPDKKQNWGTFLSLRSFGLEVQRRERSIVIDRDAYHNGRINVLFVDQHVEAFECSQVFATPPVDKTGPAAVVRNPIWTAQED